MHYSLKNFKIMNLKDFHNYFVISVGIFFEIIILASNIYVLTILLIDSFRPVKIKFERIIKKDSTKKITIQSTDARTVSQVKDEITSKQINEASVVVARTSATNAFLISLCISDLLIGVLVFPIFIFTKSRHTFWSIELCRVYRFFKYFSVLSNALSNVAIALERFRLVVFKSNYNFPLIMLNIVAFYLFAFGLSFIEISGSKLIEVNNTQLQLFGAQVMCAQSNDISLFERIIHASLYLFFASILPLALLIFFYSMILRSLTKLSKKTLGSNGDASKNNVTPKKKKLQRSFIEILIIMLFSHFPHGVLTLVEYFIDASIDPVLYFIVDVSFILTTSHAFFILYPYRYLYPQVGKQRVKNKIQPKNMDN